MNARFRLLSWLTVVCLLASSPGCWFISKKKYDEQARRATEAESQRAALAAENSDLQGKIATLTSANSDLAAKMQAASAKPAAIDKDLDKLYAELGVLAKGGTGMTWDPEAHVLRMDDVNFDFAKADLTSEGQRTIAKVAEALRNQSPNIIVRVDGHTDNIPVAKAETKKQFGDLWGLASARALGVLRALEKNGVAANRLYLRAFAAERAIAPNNTNEGRQKNRRVEISFVTRYEQAQSRAE